MSWICALHNILYAFWPQQSKSTFALFIESYQTTPLDPSFQTNHEGGFVSYEGRYFVMIRAGCIVSIYELHLVTCLSCSKKKKGKKNSNHALKPITCCTFDIIFYLSKNYLTRSPSWDEHISFSRVSWPTSRHQVNTLFQFQYSIRDKLTCRGFAKWIRSQISSSKSLTSCWRLH